MKKKLTKDEKIKFFKSEVKRLQKELSLLTWKIEISEVESADSLAEAHWYNTLECDSGGRLANILYDKAWIEMDLEKKDLTVVAFHELCELMFSKLRDYSKQNKVYISEREVDDNIHEIIRVFENFCLSEK